ncbi:MAG: disulfide bond formation protein DsbA [Gammaproteobacteria bacterium]|nr:MAG: disulfide bond formation protein DsbA [Gammaproteobacteria bacterium]HDY81680.1 DsbA family protein [Halieaceae bacterium]
MSSEPSPIVIDYFTDVLCVWAWIAQPRLDELHRQYGHDIELRHRYVDIFGDSHNKIPRQWGEADGFEKFSAHVKKLASPFDQVTVHPDVWLKVRPHSSMQAHLLLKAVELVTGDHVAVETMALRIRHAFFCEARDIGDLSLLLNLAADEKLDSGSLRNVLQNGSAIAALSNDLRSANELGVKGSPTWVLNEGRQVLYGNVGYRILSANIEELLKHPGSEASWC